MSFSNFELHYIFNDESHSMNAFVKNKCETELLSIIKEINIALGCSYEVEVNALVKGGIREFFSFKSFGKNKFAQGVIAGILINTLSSYITTDRELISLQKEQMRLNISQMENEQEVDFPAEIDIDVFIVDLNMNPIIIHHKSNFYKQLNSYSKIKKIATNYHPTNNQKTPIELEIERADFPKFIINSNELEPIIDEEAKIEIISPVLKQGKYKWRGIYLKDLSVIDFYMKDKQFKTDIIKNGLSFKNGSCITCKLEAARKIDELGNPKIYKYSVDVVFEFVNETEKIETEQGKKYKWKKEGEEIQLNLDIPKDVE
ncbi:MAG: hypothetical protein K8S23_11715 [Candidatus Cloacimonetes bacterium]|nr:hypothetical protein [Candidatus Cloacimonadota bacterium]